MTQCRNLAAAFAVGVVLTALALAFGQVRRSIGQPPDGFEVQREPAGRRLAEIGMVDVTRAPFLADSSGKEDTTQALQQAIDFARDHHMLTYLPSGTYLISDTLRAVKPGGGPRDLELWHWSKMTPCVLVGESKRSVRRPLIVLAPNSPGFQDSSRPKYVVHFWSRAANNPQGSQPDINMNQMLIGIDITIGKGNPGAVAINLNGAQGSGIQDSTVDATHGLGGIEGGAGSGGSHVGVIVIGGTFGLDLRRSHENNAPTIAGITLIGQTDSAILTDSAQTLTAVGIRIVSYAAGPVIKAAGSDSPCYRGQLCLVDSEIRFESSTKNVAISSWRSLYLNNVYVRNAAKIVDNPDHSALDGNPRGWLRVAEYAHGVRPPLHRDRYQFEAPVYVDGARWLKDEVEGVELNQPPPADLESRHLWYDDFPDWQMQGMVSVKAAPYNAKGDGETDDTSAIQRAIDEHERVLIPKGQYRVSRTIRLKSNTKLVGVAQHLSFLIVRGASREFSDPDRPKPIIETADDAHAQTVLAFLGMNVPKEEPGAYGLSWRCGRKSILRNVIFQNRPLLPGKAPVRNRPMSIVSGHGGGRWYNFYAEYSTDQGPGYRHLLVEGTTEPLYFYQCNPEHARGEANMEIRHSRYVTIYGLKSEGNHPVLWVRDSDHVRVFGYGGNAAAYEQTSLFRVERTPDFLVANAVDQPRLAGVGSDNFFAGRGVDPELWYMITDAPSDGTEIKTAPLDRPVLYRRGTPIGEPE
jgi:hypothetical protein